MQDSIHNQVRELQARLHEQERVNRELAESHARLRAILDNEPECVKLLAGDGSLLEMNPAGLRMIEADTLDQVRNHCVYPLIVDEHRDAFRALNEKVLGGGSGVLEFEVVGLKGGRRWLETHASPLRDASGAVTAMLCITRDISAHKQAEATLLASNRRMERLLESISDAFLSLDHDWRFVYINEKAAQTFGRPARELLGRRIWDEFPQLAGQPFQHAYHKAMAERMPAFVEDRYAPQDRWFENRIYPTDEGISVFVTEITERKRAERERIHLLAREQEARSQVDRILESVSDAFVALDKDWRYTYVNRRAGEIFNRRPGDLIGKHIWTEFPEGMGQPFHLAYEKAFAEQSPQTIESYYPPYDAWFENRIYPHADGLSIVFQDITGRKHAERALQESEHRLHEAQRIGRIGDWEYDVDTRALRWSPQVYALYERDPALGPPDIDGFLALYDAENRAIVEDRIASILRLRQPQSYELRVELPSGAIVHHAAIAVPVMDGSGRVVQLHGIVQDITGRRQAEQSLTASEQRFHAFMDALPAVAWVKDADGRYVYMNRAWERTFGLDAADWLGKTESDLLPAELARKLRERDLEVLATGEPMEPREEIAVLGGRYYHWQSIKFPIHDRAGDRFVCDLAIDLTESKRTEAALRETQERLSLAAEASNTGLWDWDMGTDEVYFSPIWKRQLGCDDHEIANRFEEWRDRLHPDDVEQATARLEGFLAQPRGEFENEFRLRHKDGSYRWILAKASLLRDGAGQPSRMLGAHIDITERKHAEVVLQQSERRLRMVMDGLGPHMFVGLMDTAGVVMLANRPARDVASLSEDEVLGLPVEDTYWFAYSDEVRLRMRDAVRRAARGEEVRYDERIRVAEDQLIWIDFSLHPLRDATGAITLLVPSATRIDERKRAEAALQAREAQLALVYENIEDVVFVLDVLVDGYRFAAVNPRFTEATGMDASLVVGKRVDDVIPEPSLSLVLKKYAAAVANGRRVQWEEVTHYPAGTKYGEVSVAPILDGRGRCIQLIGTVHDITERRQAEQRLREAAQRQRALSRRLVQVQEAEQRRISAELHDRIGQDLTALGIHLNIIGRSTADPPAAAARLEESRILLQNTIASLRGLITELRPPVLDDYGLLAGLRWYGGMVARRAGLEVEVHGADPDPRPPGRVEAALFRIAQEALVNATKHAHAHRVGLTLESGSGGLILEIVDDGIGFDPALLQQSGPRAHWGLEMMRERAETVGARLRIESSPGNGTRIVVEVGPAP